MMTFKFKPISYFKNYIHYKKFRKDLYKMSYQILFSCGKDSDESEFNKIKLMLSFLISYKDPLSKVIEDLKKISEKDNKNSKKKKRALKGKEK